MNTILDASALQTYSIENVLGEWAATAQAATTQVLAPSDAKLENGKVTWSPAYNNASAYALFKNGEFVGLTEEFSYDVQVGANDVLTIRAANARGGFGEPAVVTVVTGIDELPVVSAPADGSIYNMQGLRVQKAQKGLYIIDGRKVAIK